MALRLVTLVDTLDSRIEHLKSSAQLCDYNLEIIGVGKKWPRNVHKLRFLSEYLSSDMLSKNDVVMVVDAFDVVLLAGEADVLEIFEEFGADVVFSAEANYYFRESNLSLEYWVNYPRKVGSSYHFLNSGTFIGRVWALRDMLKQICNSYQVDLYDDDQLYDIRSDQYLYSRFYVDVSLSRITTSFKMILDHGQVLFGCSGGRMSVVDWPKISDVQDYMFFKFERRLLKTFFIKETQIIVRDLRFNSHNVLVNTLTGTNPPILHLPGTYYRFEQVLNGIKGKSSFNKWSLARPLALVLSTIAFVQSYFSFLIVKNQNNGKTRLEDIFPNTIDHSGKVSSMERSLGTFPKGNPFTIRKEMIK